MRQRFGNLSLRAKSLTIALILLSGFIIHGALAYMAMRRANAGIERLAASSLPKQEAAIGLARHLAGIHVDLFRFAAWSSNGVNPELIGKLGASVTESLERLGEEMGSLARRPDLRAQERTEIDAALAAWNRYEDAVRDTLDIAPTDPALGTLMLGGTDVDYRRVAERLEALSALVTSRTAERAGTLVQIGRLDQHLFLIGGGVGVLLVLVTVLSAVRAIVVPIQAITRAMRAVAEGETELRIDLPERKDELGQMMAAIDVYRKKVQRDTELLNEREHALRVQNMRFDAAMNNMSQGLCMFNAKQELIVCNKRYLDIYAIPPDAVTPGTLLQEILELRVRCGTSPENCGPYVATRMSAVMDRNPWYRIDELRDGRAIAVCHQPMADGGWVATHDDITERRRVEAQIEYLARHDALTHLANRTVLREELERALSEARPQSGVALLCLDLDRFKSVNDTLGHPVGDGLLCTVADRLRSCVVDADLVARLGGDEFSVMQLGVDSRHEATDALAARILEVLSQPYEIDGHQVVVGTSIGIAIAPEHGTDPDALFKCADLALYRAKAAGRGTFRYFEPDMDGQMQARRALELDMRRALSQSELELHYQPLVDIESGRITGVEALLRWNHPVRGRVSPAEFIPVAEETGLIVPLGEWVIREACAAASHWPAEIKIAVNLSPAQLRSKNLVQVVMNALAGSGLPGTRLELEITESVLLQDCEATLSVLHQLKALGVRISMDDFGTGYSSLSYLRTFPFDKIKIDQSFVRDLGSRPDCVAIVHAVATLGNKLGMVTTAEGVETPEQLRQLRAQGCTEVQGFLFSPPRPRAELAELFRQIPGQAASAGAERGGATVAFLDLLAEPEQPQSETAPRRRRRAVPAA